MKKIFLLCGWMLTLSFAMTSCSDDSATGNGNPVKVGDAINFSASTNQQSTRTSYGDLTDGKYPVYWENDDKVTVYCPQAQEATSADYTVAITDDSDKSSIYSLSGSNGLKWGATDEHHFYMFYPSDKVTSCENSIITATLPREQHVSPVMTEENGANIYTACNMDYALMAGHIMQKRSDVTDQTTIKLPFTPITTALDIEIKAPETGTSLVISSITIANPSSVTTGRTPLSGTFTYDISELNGEDDNWNIKSYTDSYYTVNVMLDETVTLRSGTSDVLKVTAFLLPKVANNLRIIVNARQNITDGSSSTVSKSITLQDDHFRKKTTVVMGALPNTTEFSYENWMASLSDNMYVSQISMPGTHDAGAYNTGGISQMVSQTQTLDIMSQLSAGIRVLDFRPAYNGEDFDVAHGMVTLRGVTFDGILSNTVTWLANHPTEFVIIQLKNESDDDYFTSWQQNILAKLKAVDSDYVIADFDPLMTLGEARGKLLFMSRDDYDGGWYGCKISGWPDNQASMSKTFFTASYPNGTGTLWVSDLYRGTSILSPQPTETNKKSAISAMLTKSKESTGKDLSTWYMTWLNVRGATSIANPGRVNGVYNQYAADIINGFSGSSYENAGIVMLDWANNATYNGDDIIKAVVNNNFRGGGPTKKN